MGVFPGLLEWSDSGGMRLCGSERVSPSAQWCLKQGPFYRAVFETIKLSSQALTKAQQMAFSGKRNQRRKLTLLRRNPCRAVVLNLPSAPTLNRVPRVTVTPSHKIVSFLLHNSNFAAVMNFNADIWYLWYAIPKGSRPTGWELLIFTCLSMRLGQGEYSHVGRVCMCLHLCVEARGQHEVLFLVFLSQLLSPLFLFLR